MSLQQHTPPTEVQLRVLAALIDGRVHYARDVAKQVWPDDPLWQRRTHHPGTNRNGAQGALVWLRAGQVLARLRRKGLVAEVGTERPYGFVITLDGHRALAAR